MQIPVKREPVLNSLPIILSFLRLASTGVDSTSPMHPSLPYRCFCSLLDLWLAASLTNSFDDDLMRQLGGEFPSEKCA